MRLFSCFCLYVCFSAFAGLPVRKIQITGAAQGTTYHITYFANDSTVSKKQIDSILNRIDSSLSLYKPYSLINRFNRSGKGIIADEHLLNVTRKALNVYQTTGGLFDITVYPLTDAWGFGPVKTETLPDSSTIKRIMPCVSSRLLYLHDHQLLKHKPCVQLDANGIAQGYSVDVLAGFLERNHIQDYLVELGGEIRIKGRKRPGNDKMTIGIETPDDDTSGIMYKIIRVDQGAVTTSGNYRRYHESQGQKISHLLDPRTGYPVRNELISVTVYAPDAITADAYDNALMAMGLEKAIAFVNSRNHLAAYFIYHRPDGTIADTASRNFSALIIPDF